MNNEVTLRDNAFTTPSDRIEIPLAYWTYGLATELKQGEKHAYLICLAEQDQSVTAPLWGRSQMDLAKTYSISRHAINDGFNGLQRRDLLTIFRDTIPTRSDNNRRPNRYRLKPLLSPEARAGRWEKLKEKHSPLLIVQARALASLIDYGNDFDAADELAAAITAYGYQTVSNTTAQVATKNVTNPNRCPGTITTYLRTSQRAP